MGHHLTLKIQTSSLFLKAKNAISLHRKSPSSSSSTSPTTTSPTSYSPTDSTVLSPPLSTTSIVTPTTPTTDSQKVNRFARFKVKTFSSFGRSASLPHDTTNQTKSVVTPTKRLAFINPFSSWRPFSTVAALKSPTLGGISSLKASGEIYDPLQSIYSSSSSPAPNRILQSSPDINVTPRCASGKRSQTFSLRRHHRTTLNVSNTLMKSNIIIIGSQ
ncbi:hypothetical protein BGZ49_007308, partial [Haplosporangium sp. Z 27]